LEIVNCAFNDQFLARSNTLSTQDAFAQVPLYEWIHFFNGGHLGNPLEFNPSDAHIRGKLAQLASVAFVAHKAGIGMAGEHELNYISAMFHNTRGVCIDDHSWGYGCDT
jgi:hypothetical protein